MEAKSGAKNDPQTYLQLMNLWVRAEALFVIIKQHKFIEMSATVQKTQHCQNYTKRRGFIFASNKQVKFVTSSVYTILHTK